MTAPAEAVSDAAGGTIWEEGRTSVPKARAMLKMLARTGFVGAFLLGLGALTGLYLDRGLVLWVHIAFGLLFLVPAWLIANQPAPRRRLVQAGAGVGTLGALLVVGRFLFWPSVSPWWHVALMLVAIALVEMGGSGERTA